MDLEKPISPMMDRKGYNPDFLGVSVPMPTFTKAIRTTIVHYLNFSIAIHKSRKMPYFTAVNIDAVKYNALKDQIPSRKEIGADRWIFDPRLAKEVQLAKSFYENNDFDLGHMVRREDALWGDTLEEALIGNNDTFYLTNATPQHKDFNRNAERWKGLEDYAIKSARKHALLISVFTGCIFKSNDRKLNNIQIPAKFWKIIVMKKADGQLSATGYIINQDDLIEDITARELFVYDQFKTYQVNISDIEMETGLQFGLNEYDPRQTIQTRSLDPLTPTALDSWNDIVF
jgi:endonuclease G